MGLKRTDEFRKDAVRTALTSGLTRKQVADDLDVGMSTLNMVLSRFSSGLFRAMFAMKERTNGKEIHR
jgi:transposase-like protein